MGKPTGLGLFVGLCLFLGGCADDPSTEPVDTVAPDPIEDLRILEQTPRTVSFNWTAPAEDGPEGRATRYEMRYRLESISESTFGAGTVVPTPVPQSPGGTEVLRVSSLTPGSTYGFAIRSEDLAGNVSELSNIVVVTLAQP